jgi:hypothetical protein
MLPRRGVCGVEDDLFWREVLDIETGDLEAMAVAGKLGKSICEIMFWGELGQLHWLGPKELGLSEVNEERYK